MNRYYWILGGFAALVALLAIGLGLNPRDVPSPLVGKPAPAFALPLLPVAGEAKTASFGPADMKGKVWLLNVWASWCVSCREEHPLLLAFAKTGQAPLVGLNYKDKDADAQRWLAQFGNPYLKSAVDADGRVGIDYGVYGVPETFVLDAHGVIQDKVTGMVSFDGLSQSLEKLL